MATSSKSRPFGKLDADPARRNGKIVDEWSFHAALPAKKASVDVKVKVYLAKGKDGLTFRAELDDFQPIEDSDIQHLHSRVEAALMKHSAEKMGAIWEDWLKVRVIADDQESTDGGGRGRDEAGLKIVVEHVKRGVDPQTGEAFLLSESGLWAVPMPAPKSLKDALEADRERRAKGGIQFDSLEEFSFVPATEANLAALHYTRERLRFLRSRLAEALSQQTVQSLLNTVTEGVPSLLGHDKAD